MAKIILDAGHGGSDPGAVYNGRLEKDDTLRLALAVGDILEDNGVEVAYTRTEDVYDTPYEKAQIANREGGDFFVSIHRNSSPEPNQYSGVETLVYDKSGQKAELAEAINAELEDAGFRNLGVKERPGLVVLRRTRMPAVLVEAGFLNTEADNALFDDRFEEVARAIANGILETLGLGRAENPDGDAESGGAAGDGGSSWGGGSGESGAAGDGGSSWGEGSGESGTAGSGSSWGGDSGESGAAGDGSSWGGGSGESGSSGGSGSAGGAGTPGGRKLYRVQVGAFRRREYAEDLLYRLLRQNYPAYILLEDGYFKVQVGAFRWLDNAVRMEGALRKRGYSTYITT